MFADIALLLLAAGRGQRFGGGKLGAILGGEPVLYHSARMLGRLPFAHRIATVGPTTPDLGPLGFEMVELPDPESTMSASIAAGIAAIRQLDVSAAMICLGDMPFVPAAHIHRMIESFDGDRLASICAGRTMPPALFARAHFGALEALSGDRGAGALLAGAPAIELSPDEALDIDTAADLARAAALLSPA